MTTQPTDWWDRLYADDKPAPAPAPVRGGARLPDWRTGQHADLTTPGQDTPDTDTDRDTGEDTDRDSTPGTSTPDSAPTSTDTPDTADSDQDDTPDTGQDTGQDTPVPPWRRALTHPGNRPTYRDPEPAVRPPRAALADTWHTAPARLRWLAYHATAAAAGWTLGLVDYATHVTTWIAAAGLTHPQAWFWYAAAGATVLLHHRTRGLWLPVAWPATIPLASTITGIALYAPGA
ncbi:hypothetical protein [Streptomyces sp. WMMC897]|uniref:hypothetical protein n=1 Tax=Streptomyces sp. WMMC897 TaxID=3014782 RepID=UPI0022B6F693|nr:hypothetical protein [Streptomyces sp. WMMC897]MCZ7413059.1 hypothetical protein [Streptomyces sp. WMMC897]MCZ7413147.1 hypothetical protein [Streptomyces sp. WMMC897]MCZ7415469.1 hypothetical protein [Streptomyces sp. WMMC897]